MAEKVSLNQKVSTLLNNVRYYWNEAPKGRFMSFKEILSYSVGGIGAYLIVTMSWTCLLGATNTFISGTIGIKPKHMYIMYVLAVLASIPLSGLRASIVDNTRNKAGKYRPYLLSMGIPASLLFVLEVWFPYDKLGLIVGDGQIFGESAAYIAKCAVLLLINFLLQFFFTFFYDAYENLIHVLSPNSQERADASAIKSVIYSLGPSIVNMIMPIVANEIFHTNLTDIRVYRLVFPILGILGSLLLCLVYANTQEKIIQAKTHVVQIKFADAFKAVMKNKYFWIISLAGWIGFLESAFANILYWLYNYGGACNGDVYSVITLITGNASLWGMLLAPFCIRKWGKRNVLVVTNMFNIAFIALMLCFTGGITTYTIWLFVLCIYFNTVLGSFGLILNPSIQADIRDYQQYITGERIDGMFAAVGTIGSVITLATAGVIPALYERFGMTVENAKNVVNNTQIMSRVLPGGTKTIGEMLLEQKANGMDIYNPANALYDVEGVLLPLLRILIIVSIFGAVLNVVPFFFYDFNEKKQKAVVRVLKVRALFEDYANNALNDRELVEAIDLVNNSKEMAVATPKLVTKETLAKSKNKAKAAYKKTLADCKNIADKAQRETAVNAAKTELKEAIKLAKKQYKDDVEFNEEIEISQFVCDELDKFSSAKIVRQLELYKEVFDAGLSGIENMDVDKVRAELNAARALPKSTKEEKELRKIEIEIAKKKLSSYKHYQKHYGSVKEFEEPDMTVLEGFFAEEDRCDEAIEQLTKEINEAKKAKDAKEVSELKTQVKEYDKKRKAARVASKAEMDKFAVFNRSADAYITARKLLTQQENFSHFDDIAALYDEAKIRAEEDERIKREEADRKMAELDAELEKRKNARKAKKNK